MADYSQRVIEICSLVKNKDALYKSKSKELIEDLKKMDPKSWTGESQLTAILLSFIIGEYSIRGLSSNKINLDTVKFLEIILNKINSSTFTDASSQFGSINGTIHKINPQLIEACKQTYLERQINFVSQFYSKITLKSLKDFFPEKDVDKIIHSQGWIKEKNYVVINDRKATADFDAAKQIQDIQYNRSMNIQLNALIKEHQNLVDYLNKKEKK